MSNQQIRRERIIPECCQKKSPCCKTRSQSVGGSTQPESDTGAAATRTSVDKDDIVEVIPDNTSIRRSSRISLLPECCLKQLPCCKGRFEPTKTRTSVDTAEAKVEDAPKVDDVPKVDDAATLDNEATRRSSRSSLLPECCQKQLPCCKSRSPSTRTRTSVEMLENAPTELKIPQKEEAILNDVPQTVEGMLDDEPPEPKVPQTFDDILDDVPPELKVPQTVEVILDYAPAELKVPQTVEAIVDDAPVELKVPQTVGPSDVEPAPEYEPQPQPPEPKEPPKSTADAPSSQSTISAPTTRPQQAPRAQPTLVPRRGYAQVQEPSSDYEQLLQAPKSSAQASKSCAKAPRTCAKVPRSCAQAPRSYMQAPKSYTQAPRNYTQAPTSYVQAPMSYVQAPSGYSQAPSGYSQAPMSYTQAPRSYAQAPSGYSQAPSGYAQDPSGYSQDPRMYGQIILEAPSQYSEDPRVYGQTVQASSGYSQDPSEYSQDPRRYGRTLEVPRGYSQNPKRYGQTLQVPRGYSSGLQRSTTSRAPPGPPGVGEQKTSRVGMLRPPIAAISQTTTAEFTKPQPKGGAITTRVLSRTTITVPGQKASKKTVEMTKQVSGKDIGKPKGIPLPKQSRLQRFDKTVTAELSRRKTTATVTTTTTSDTNLLEAVDKLARAEAAHSFTGAVAAAEAAAADALDAAAAEEAAAEGARCYQAEIVDVVTEDVPGDKPIQVIGYVGITRPKYAAR